jgi:DNA-binding transcriptional MerR regulator
VSTDTGALQIGEFARPVGVSPELLRAWECRYGLLQPIRSEGGFRLYTTGDAERVEQMKRALDGGLSAAEAACRALAPAWSTEAALGRISSRRTVSNAKPANAWSPQRRDSESSR